MLLTMKNKHLFSFLYGVCFSLAVFTGLQSCSPAQKAVAYKPARLSADALRADFRLLRTILEEEHPSTYWYTSEASMSAFFDNAYASITDSMTEIQFRNLVARTINQLRCGHTSVRASKPYEKYLARTRLALFPFGMRVWNDTMAVTYNLWRRDTLLKRGDIVKSINGLSAQQIRDSIFSTITTDGYADNFKNIRLSGNFPYYHYLLFDTSKQYRVVYTDSAGAERSLTVGLYRPPKPDSSRRVPPRPSTTPAPSRRQVKKFNRESIRRLRIDTAASIAYIDLNSFSGGKLKKFFRHSFKTMRRLNIQNLVLDLRNNGGGLIGNSIALTKHIGQKKFKIADTVFSKVKFSRYNRYIKNRFWYGLGMLFVTRKKSDGNYHFGWWERHYYRPKKRNHFNGNVYCITGGYSFSATTLFLNIVKDQPNVVLVGEETGGSAYGNSAVFLSDIKLPESKLRVRLPMFRLVMNKNVPQDGRGIQPHITIGPGIEAIKKQNDPKMDKVKELIRNGYRKP
jgi:hypothetical protein